VTPAIMTNAAIAITRRYARLEFFFVIRSLRRCRGPL
jgi:hypothetical protein